MAEKRSSTADGGVWDDDRLERSREAAFLKNFLIGRVAERKAANQPASYVLNIDAQWGQGKSFFLTRFAKLLRADGYLVAEVNAWQDDHADDPLLSVMDSIDAAVAPLVKREKKARERWNTVKRAGGAVAVAVVKGAATQLAKKAIGAAVDEIPEIIASSPINSANEVANNVSKTIGDALDKEGQALLERFRQGKQTIQSFRESLATFLATAEANGQSLPLFVFVDELDRCRPPFAIATLERIKHLFDLDQVIFVVATDTAQLRHSVGAVYGTGFNSEGYLSRFFNRTYYFSKSSRDNFINQLLERFPIDSSKISLPPRSDVSTFLSAAFNYFSLSLRDTEQIYDILRTFISAWDSRIQVEMVPLLAIAIAHQQRFDLPLDDFIEQFKVLSSRITERGAKWRFEFPTDSYREPTTRVDFTTLANDFFSRIRKALPEISRDAGAVHSEWVASRLGAEFSVLHGNTYSRLAAPMSIIRSYPEMVRSAGRLLSQKLD